MGCRYGGSGLQIRGNAQAAESASQAVQVVTLTEGMRIALTVPSGDHSCDAGKV